MSTDTELALIHQHVKLSATLDHAKLNLNYSEPENQKKHQDVVDQVRAELAVIEGRLMSVVPKDITAIKRRNILGALEGILRQFNATGLPLSQEQGTIIHNAVFGYVIYDMIKSFEADYRQPYVSCYAVEPDGKFDSSILRKSVEVAIKELQDMATPDYVELKHFIDSQQEKIRNLANSPTK